MEVDPEASMRVWAVEVELGGRTFEIPALPAADWYPILSRGNVAEVLDLIQHPVQEEDPIELILSGEVTSEDLTEALTAAIEQASGRSLNATLSLVHLARSAWPVIGGGLARRGFRWDVSPLGAALDAIYVTAMEVLKPEARTKLQALLDSEGPPRRQAGGRRRVNRDRALSDFEAMAGPRPQPAPANGARSGGGLPRTPPRPPQRPQVGR